MHTKLLRMEMQGGNCQKNEGTMEIQSIMTNKRAKTKQIASANRQRNKKLQGQHSTGNVR